MKHLAWSVVPSISPPPPPPDVTRCRGVGSKDGLVGPTAEPRRLGGFSVVVWAHVTPFVMTKLLRLVAVLPRLAMERGLTTGAGAPSHEEAPKAAAGGTEKGRGRGRGMALLSRGAKMWGRDLRRPRFFPPPPAFDTFLRWLDSRPLSGGGASPPWSLSFFPTALHEDSHAHIRDHSCCE